MNYDIPTLYRRGVRLIRDDKAATVSLSLYMQRFGRIYRPIKPGNKPASLAHLHALEDAREYNAPCWMLGGLLFLLLSWLAAIVGPEVF